MPAAVVLLVTQVLVALVALAVWEVAEVVAPIETTAPRAVAAAQVYWDKDAMVQQAVQYHWDNLADLVAAEATMLLVEMEALLVVVEVQAINPVLMARLVMVVDWYI